VGVGRCAAAGQAAPVPFLRAEGCGGVLVFCSVFVLRKSSVHLATFSRPINPRLFLLFPLALRRHVLPIGDEPVPGRL